MISVNNKYNKSMVQNLWTDVNSCLPTENTDVLLLYEDYKGEKQICKGTMAYKYGQLDEETGKIKTAPYWYSKDKEWRNTEEVLGSPKKIKVTEWKPIIED